MKRTHHPQAVAPRFWTLLAGVLLPLSLISGCSTMNNTEQGVLGGAAVGGFLGTLLGVATGRPLQGAAIGAGIGGAVGGVHGAAEDRRERRDAQWVAAAVQNSQNELMEVAKMARGGVSDPLIIQHVRNSGAIFNLSSEQILWLKQQGVSEVVIQEMEYCSSMRRVRPAYVVAQPAPVVVVEQAPPPPPGIYVGATIGR